MQGILDSWNQINTCINKREISISPWNSQVISVNAHLFRVPIFTDLCLFSHFNAMLTVHYRRFLLPFLWFSFCSSVEFSVTSIFSMCFYFSVILFDHCHFVTVYKSIGNVLMTISSHTRLHII